MKTNIGTLLPLTAIKSIKHPNSLLDSSKEFIDWMKKNKQSNWEILPLHPTHWKGGRLLDSPYSSYGIGVNIAIKGLFGSTKAPSSYADEFYFNNKFWLDDLALFLTLSEKFGTDSWYLWPKEYSNYKGFDHKAFIQQHTVSYERHVENQVNAHYILTQIKEYSNQNNVEIWGDMPFFVALNSPLVWKFREYFEVGKNGELSYQSGVVEGKQFPRQAWGHPLYKWWDNKDVHNVARIFDYRLKYFSGLFDRVRLDAVARIYFYDRLHLSDQSKDERNQFGPGTKLFRKILTSAKNYNLNPFIEDISDVDMTKMHEEMKEQNVPGISILTLAIPKERNKIDSDFFDLTLSDTNHIYYTSNHDTPTLYSYLQRSSEKKVRYLCELIDATYHNSPTKTFLSVRNTLIHRVNNIIIPLQDWLGSKKQINTPGINRKNNWNYKMSIPIENLKRRTLHIDEF